MSRIIAVLEAGCASPVTVSPSPTATEMPTIAPTATQSADALLAAQIDGIVTNMAGQDKFSRSILVNRRPYE